MAQELINASVLPSVLSTEAPPDSYILIFEITFNVRHGVGGILTYDIMHISCTSNESLQRLCLDVHLPLVFIYVSTQKKKYLYLLFDIDKFRNNCH